MVKRVNVPLKGLVYFLLLNRWRGKTWAAVISFRYLITDGEVSIN